MTVTRVGTAGVMAELNRQVLDQGVIRSSTRSLRLLPSLPVT